MDGDKMNEQIELSLTEENPFHPVACLVCGREESRWVDTFICNNCHTSGRAAIEFETLKRENEQYKRERTR
jgi:hypothetical protein